MKNSTLKKVTYLMLLGGIFPLQALASDAVPAVLSLEIGKDTLALAEPFYLQASICNLTEEDLFINTTGFFSMDNVNTFQLYMIAPDGEIWKFGSVISATYELDQKLYFRLRPKQATTDGVILFWGLIAPLKYHYALEKMPPGLYKIYATYRLPGPKKVEGLTIYSDTLELHILPLVPEHLPSLIAMDSFNYTDEFKTRPLLNLLKVSNTPYQESAWATLVNWCEAPDSFASAKAAFDKAYPNSQFTRSMILRQLNLTWRKGLSVETDSLTAICNEILPSSIRLINWGFRPEIQTLSERERRELK